MDVSPPPPADNLTMTSCSERVYIRGEEKGKALYPQMDLILVSPGSVVALGLSVGVETTGEKHWKHKVPPSSRREEAAGGEHGEEVEVSQLPPPAQRKDNGVPKVRDHHHAWWSLLEGGEV